jgi:hypothetical protein
MPVMAGSVLDPTEGRVFIFFGVYPVAGGKNGSLHQIADAKMRASASATGYRKKKELHQSSECRTLSGGGVDGKR